MYNPLKNENNPEGENIWQ
uniref:Uncharacterized protein n=1 Tax=Anguilla anguilla TaxID=7936 RepID=A0A0E9PRV6_ANGAN